MTRIIKGIFNFQKNVHGTQEQLFKNLGAGQKPLALFITCSDSRISPDMLTQTQPGELFIMRNAGNIVSPCSWDHASGEAATLEYAVKQLKVREVIICGHAKCGAVHGLLHLDTLDALPEVKRWLQFSEPVLAALKKDTAGMSPEEVLAIAIERNVLQQLENVKSYPFVSEAVERGELRLHAWVYHFETGTVLAHDQTKNRFVSLSEATKPKFSATQEEVETYNKSRQSGMDLSI